MKTNGILLIAFLALLLLHDANCMKNLFNGCCGNNEHSPEESVAEATNSNKPAQVRKLPKKSTVPSTVRSTPSRPNVVDVAPHVQKDSAASVRSTAPVPTPPSASGPSSHAHHDSNSGSIPKLSIDTHGKDLHSERTSDSDSASTVHEPDFGYDLEQQIGKSATGPSTSSIHSYNPPSGSSPTPGSSVYVPDAASHVTSTSPNPPRTSTSASGSTTYAQNAPSSIPLPESVASSSHPSQVSLPISTVAASTKSAAASIHSLPKIDTDVASYVSADPATPVISTSPNLPRPSTSSGSTSHDYHDHHDLSAPLPGTSPVTHKEASLGEKTTFGDEMEQSTPKEKVPRTNPSKSPGQTHTKIPKLDDSSSIHSQPKHHSGESVKDESRDASGHSSPDIPVETGKKLDNSHGTSKEHTAQGEPLNNEFGEFNPYEWGNQAKGTTGLGLRTAPLSPVSPIFPRSPRSPIFQTVKEDTSQND